MVTAHCTLSSLRSALNHLYEPRALQSSPLMKVLSSAGQSHTPSTLRELLVRAIESLRPADGIPSQSVAWRPYEILHYRYVQQCTQEEVADQLGLSVRHLKREQGKALDLLAERLRDRYSVQIDVGEKGAAATTAKQDNETPAIRDELHWLEHSPPAKSVALDDVLPTVLGLVQSIAARYEVRLHVDQAGGLPPLAVRAVALRQLLLSLLYVAIRRTAGARLSVSARRKGWDVEIRIRGEAAQTQAAPNSEDDANLAVARQLADAYSGALVLAERSGFAVTLTLLAAEQLSVLVIDDNPDALRLLQRYASGTRYRVVGAQDPEQAFALACRNRPQIIVLDVMMPEVDGWELLGRLKQHPLTGHIPILACTILAQEELAFSLGVAGFLHKPVSRRDFLAALDRLRPRAES